MGDESGQSSIDAFVFFLDENHCRNPHMISAITEGGFLCEKHLDHFEPGIADTLWLPEIARRGWSLITTDARIRTNLLEREAVRRGGVRMFYFSRNNLAGREMGVALRKALPSMVGIILSQRAPFTASINKSGQVTLKDIF